MRTRRQSVIFYTVLCMVLSITSLVQAANFVVTNANDSGPGSFREAINMAISSGEDDTITFGSNLEDKTIVLLTELPRLSSGTTINGAGSPIINGASIWKATGLRIYNVNRVTVSGLRLVGFRFGIDIDWTVNDIVISNNRISANTVYTDDRVTIAYNARSGLGPISSNITFSGNRVENGRFGIYVNEAGYQVQHVVIEDNTAIGYKSDISINTAYASGSSVTDVRISNNTADGISLLTSHQGATTDNCTISNVIISHNTLENSGNIDARIYSGSNNKIIGLIIEQNKIVNSRSEGVCLDNQTSASNIIDATIRNNIVVGCAPEGIQCSGWVTAKVMNNLSGGNREGIKFDGNCTITAANNLIIKNNDGLFVEEPATVQLVNNLVIENCLCGIETDAIRTAQDVGLSYNNVWNNGTGYCNLSKGNTDISVNPLLVNPASGDFHLSPGSPCIDAGNPAIVYNDAIPPGLGTDRSDIGLYGGPGAEELVLPIPIIDYYSGIFSFAIANIKLSDWLNGIWGGKYAFHPWVRSSPCTTLWAKAISPSLQEIQLYDDGTHGDFWANDGEYGNIQFLPNHPETGIWKLQLMTKKNVLFEQTVNLGTNNLPVPVFESPYYGSTVATLSPTLTWHPIIEAKDGYTIGIFDGIPQTFGPEGIIFAKDIDNPQVTYFVVPEGLLEWGKTYYWFIMASDDHDNDGYNNQSMEMWNFNTNVELMSDINKDGKVDISDVILVLRIALKLDSLRPCSDINNDGTADISDVILTLRMALGLDPLKPCQK